MQKTLHSEQATLFLQMLRDVRLATGMTQSKLARKLQIEQTVVSKIETGLRRLDVVELHAWLRALGVPLTEFVSELDTGLAAIAVRNEVGRRRVKADR